MRDGRIAAIGDAVDAPPEVEEVDADGQVVLPAFVDPHVHLRVPGQEWKEDLATGSRAAAAGGYCAVLSMPNTDPVIDTGAVLEAALERAREEAVVRVGFLACVSVGQLGEQLAELGDLADRGAAGFTDDGRPVWSAGLLRRALQYARPLGLPIALHCEEPTLSRGGHAHEGAVAAELGFGGWPSIAESTMVARDLRIAAYEDAHVHLQHLSVRESVEEVAWARARRLRVTAEATPHHLVLTDEALRGARRQRQDEPAARDRERPQGADRRGARRHDRLHRHRPRAARAGGEGAAVRGGAVRRDRAGDGVPGALHGARAAGPAARWRRWSSG